MNPATSSYGVTNGGEDTYISYSPSRSPIEKKRRSVKLFNNKPKNFTLIDVTNTPKSPSTTATIHSKPPTPSPMGKQSKKQLVLQVAQLEQELKLVKYKATTLAEQNEELKLKLATASATASVDTLQGGSKMHELEEENKRLKTELDGYITKKWREFCAVQDSPTPTRKRAYFSREQE